MTDMTDDVAGQFERRFGFSKGTWFGVITCNDQEDAAHNARTGIFLGKLVLISKRTLPVNKVRVNSISNEITVFDGEGSCSVSIPYTVRVSRSTTEL